MSDRLTIAVRCSDRDGQARLRAEAERTSAKVRIAETDYRFSADDEAARAQYQGARRRRTTRCTTPSA